MKLPSAYSDASQFIARAGWLSAAVLGASDGIVSTSALLVGVAAAEPWPSAVAVAGIAGVTAGAMSMAASEYVSVSSQADIQRADIQREKKAIKEDPDVEYAELVAIYKERGLTDKTAQSVAKEMMAHDPLGAHVRDELGLSDIHAANPLQESFAAGATFTVAGSVPLLAALLAPADYIIHTVLVVTVLALAVLGFLGARMGGAPVGPSVFRIVGWGVFAMAVTAGIGTLIA